MLWDLEKYKENKVLIDEYGAILTYEQLKFESEKVADAIGERCLVFSLCKNEIGAVVGYVGFLNHDIVPVLLSSNLDKELLDTLLITYCPSYLWMPEERSEQFADCTMVYKIFDYVLLRTKYETNYPLYDELGLLLTTSGSTGSPKLVRQSYRNILHNARSIAAYLELNENERPITTLPMHYTYGLSVINSHLLTGAAILINDRSVMQREFWDFLKRERATSFAGVPYTYEILDKLRFMRMDLPYLTTMTQAGGKLMPELHEKFASFALQNGKKFIVMYGQCEATARMGYLPAEKAVEKKGSMGIAIPDGKFYLVDEAGDAIITPYVTGELVYEGLNVTLGYAECGDDLLKGDERCGKLSTGDMAQFDEDGYYYIVGRKKRFLKIYGNRINLDEIDNLIKSKFQIEVASAGIDDHMYIFIVDGSLADEVRTFVISKTGLNPSAFKTIVISEIPKNDSGKILFKELAKYYES